MAPVEAARWWWQCWAGCHAPRPPGSAVSWRKAPPCSAVAFLLTVGVAAQGVPCGWQSLKAPPGRCGGAPVKGGAPSPSLLLRWILGAAAAQAGLSWGGGSTFTWSTHHTGALHLCAQAGLHPPSTPFLPPHRQAMQPRRVKDPAAGRTNMRDCRLRTAVAPCSRVYSRCTHWISATGPWRTCNFCPPTEPRCGVDQRSLPAQTLPIVRQGERGSVGRTWGRAGFHAGGALQDVTVICGRAMLMQGRAAPDVTCMQAACAWTVRNI